MRFAENKTDKQTTPEPSILSPDEISHGALVQTDENIENKQNITMLISDIPKDVKLIRDINMKNKTDLSDSDKQVIFKIIELFLLLSITSLTLNVGSNLVHAI